MLLSSAVSALPGWKVLRAKSAGGPKVALEGTVSGAWESESAWQGTQVMLARAL